MILFLVSSCQRYSVTNKGQFLFFEGLNNKEALLSKIITTKLGKKSIVPLERIFTNTKIQLPAGNYLLSNECSSYEFTHESNSPSRIVLSHLQLQLLSTVPPLEEIHDENQVVESLCYNILNQKEYTYHNKVQFDILPGKNNFFISGKNLTFDIQPELFQNLSLNLNSLSLLSSSLTPDSPHFFVTQIDSLKSKKKIVISAPINGKIWLFPGKYLVEVNGTKKNIVLDNKTETKVQLGLLKVTSPKQFPFEKRMQSGGQPISAFIDDKVLIRLNTAYPVFSGKYRVNLEGSELDKEIIVQENLMTDVKTFGAQINAPSCNAKIASCFNPLRITIHENKQPFILMVVPVNEPFLVFDKNDYQYGVEGVKGVFKSLPTSSDSVKSDTLGLVNIKWEIRYTSSNNTTDFVRFESKSPNLYGKSVDLSFFRPSEVYLPEGDYWFTYYVGDATNQNIPKIRTEVNLSNGNIKDITVPVYVHGNKGPQNERGINTISPSQSSTLAPIKK